MFKKINTYFKNNKMDRINKIEHKRKEIYEKLPDKSFSKKLYSFERLDKEIILLKIGKEVIDISFKRNKYSASFKYKKSELFYRAF